jgi:hypothetical protein
MATPVAPLRARWHRWSLAETDASDRGSAACYRRTILQGGLVGIDEYQLNHCSSRFHRPSYWDHHVYLAGIRFATGSGLI